MQRLPRTPSIPGNRGTSQDPQLPETVKVNEASIEIAAEVASE